MTAVVVRSARAAEYAGLLEAAGVETAAVGEVLLADPTMANESELDGVEWIQSTWAGIDALDWSRVPAGTVVTSLPGVFGPQMAEFVFGHLLGRTQRIPERHAGRTWDETPPGALRGSTLGVLGAGSIGASIAEVARVFGMPVRGCRRAGGDDPRFDEMFSIADVHRFATGLDHLVVVLPATADTHRLVDGTLLARLAPGASLINVGRGRTVDTSAVVEAVRSGKVGWAVLDVTDPEPLPAGHPAWGEPKIVVTGHTAAISHPADIVRFFVENLARFDRGEELVGVVDRSKGY